MCVEAEVPQRDEKTPTSSRRLFVTHLRVLAEREVLQARRRLHHGGHRLHAVPLEVVVVQFDTPQRRALQSPHHPPPD
jgi:hypothetical protein